MGKQKNALITGITGQDGAYLAEYLLGIALNVQGSGIEIFQRQNKHQRQRVYLFRSKRSYGYKQTAERYAAVQHSKLHEQSAFRARKYCCGSR